MILVPNDLHRVFIQALLSRRTMLETSALELYKRCVMAVRDNHPGFRETWPIDSKGLKGFMLEVSSLVEEFGFDIRRAAEQTDEARPWICLVNRDPLDNASDLSKSVSDLSPLEISFYRKVVLRIIDSYPANSVGSKAALTIAGLMPTSIPKVTAESLLATLVSRGWLSKSQRGRYTLAPRATWELENYLLATYGNPAEEADSALKACSDCKKLVFAGYKCPWPECDGHIHARCKATKKAAERETCRDCRHSWDVRRGGQEVTPIGEDAVAEGDDFDVRIARRAGREQDGAAGDGEDSDSEEDEVTRESNARGARRPRMASSDDSD